MAVFNKPKRIYAKTIATALIWHPRILNWPSYCWVIAVFWKSRPTLGDGKKLATHPYPLACPWINLGNNKIVSQSFKIPEPYLPLRCIIIEMDALIESKIHFSPSLVAVNIIFYQNEKLWVDTWGRPNRKALWLQ